MPRAKTKPASPPVVPPAQPVPIAMDLGAIQRAMITLGEIVVLEERRIATPEGAMPPDWPRDNRVGQMIFCPLGVACKRAYQELQIHLVNLIGEAAATEVSERVLRGSRERADARSAPAPAAIVRH